MDKFVQNTFIDQGTLKIKQLNIEDVVEKRRVNTKNCQNFQPNWVDISLKVAFLNSRAIEPI